MKKGYTHLTEKEYNNIRRLKAAGITQGEACQLAKRSTATINFIYNSDTWTDYRARTDKVTRKIREARHEERAERAAAKAAALRPVEEIVGKEAGSLDGDMLEGREHHALIRIADALERLANVAEAEPAKRKLF